MGKFIITKKPNGLYYYTLKADNGQVMLSSEGYSSISGVMNGIQSVKHNATDLLKFEKKKSSNGKFFFILKARNGAIIGCSQLYENENSIDRNIDVIMKDIQKSIITEEKF
jgi:uncharacterized protein YegP (UPF0339 family)